MKPEIHDILKPLEYFSRPYPKAAIDHAIANPSLVINDLKRSISSSKMLRQMSMFATAHWKHSSSTIITKNYPSRSSRHT